MLCFIVLTIICFIDVTSLQHSNKTLNNIDTERVIVEENNTKDDDHLIDQNRNKKESLLDEFEDVLISTKNEVLNSPAYPVTIRGGGYIPPQLPFDYRKMGAMSQYPYVAGLQAYPIQVNPYYPRPFYFTPKFSSRFVKS